MGMYDYINGEQVKCFRVPVYYGKDAHSQYGVSSMGGNLRSFNNLDIVPFNSYNYNYGKNFMIFDVNPENFDSIDIDEAFEDLFENLEPSKKEIKEDVLKFCMHVIKDGKVLGTFYKTDQLEDFFKDNNTVVGYCGEPINIKSTSDIVQYISDKKEYEKQHDIYFKEYIEVFKEYMDNAHGIGLLDEDSTEYKERIKRFYELSNLLKEHIEMSEKNFEHISKAYSNKWFFENKYQLEETFGEFIDAYFHLLFALRDNPEDEYYKKSFEEIDREFREFIENNDILDKYFIWNDGLSIEQIENIKILIKQIKGC